MDSQQSARILRRRAVHRILRLRARGESSPGVSLAVIVGAATYHFEQPVYRTSAQVLLPPQYSVSSLMSTPAPVRPTVYDVAQVNVVQSGPVAQAASAGMPGHPSPELFLSQVTASVDPADRRDDDRRKVRPKPNPQPTLSARRISGTPKRSSIGKLVAVVKDVSPSSTGSRHRSPRSTPKSSYRSPGSTPGTRPAITSVKCELNRPGSIEVSMSIRRTWERSLHHLLACWCTDNGLDSTTNVAGNPRRSGGRGVAGRGGTRGSARWTRWAALFATVPLGVALRQRSRPGRLVRRSLTTPI